ncbi:MAG: HAMP domain-containing sensor histidine kinase [Eubacteriales bacterium]|nr:HAMP domain-containing sensor histidine kinase [Eubacteriales bacterium]
MFPWILCGILLISVLLLIGKNILLKRSMDEICAEFKEHLLVDTNTLVSISSNDAHVKKLASEINVQLRLLREQRHRYLTGDRELKDAVTNISHDLRTPLTAICGYLDLLEREDKPETVGRYLSLIENRVEAMTQLTEELFRYSVILSVRELELETVHVNGVLEESIAAFYAALTERGIHPEIHMTGKRIERCLNKEALSRVFSNILNNALKYSEGDLDIRLLDSGEISFSNTAPGLNGVLVGKLFDRFFTVEAGRNSNGLGLAISKTLMEQMGGTISAAYLDGKLTIRVGFPEG